MVGVGGLFSSLVGWWVIRLVGYQVGWCWWAIQLVRWLVSVGYKVGWRRWAIKLVVWLVLVGY